MGITRRQFLKWSGVSAMGAVVFNGCTTPEQELQVESPVNMPEDLVNGIDNWYATICRQESEACGIIVRVVEGRAKKIEGNPDYPINKGKHSVRSEAGVQALYHPDRLIGPMYRDSRNSEFRSVSLEEAHNLVLNKLNALNSEGQNDRALLITQPLRGHLAVLASEFSNGFGGRHMAFETLDKVALRNSLGRVFGQSRLPKFDIEHSTYLISFGADFLSSWISPTNHSKAYGEFRQGHSQRGIHVQVDPRFSMSAANADEWLPVKPGSEGILAMSMIYVIIKDGLGDATAADSLTGGEGHQALEAFSNNSAGVIEATGIDGARIEKIARDFANSHHPLAIGGGSAGASTTGSFNLDAIYSLNVLVNNLNKEGGVVFNPSPPITVLDNDFVTGAGMPSSYQDWKNINQPRVVMIRGANPIHGLPSSAGFSNILDNSEFIISYSSFMDETTEKADLIIPESNYLEDWGDDVPEPGPGYQVIGVQQPVVGRFHQGTVNFGDELIYYSRVLGLALDGNLGLTEGSGFKELLEESMRELWSKNAGSVRSSDFEAFRQGVLQRGGWWDVESEAKIEEMPSKSLETSWPDMTFAGTGEYNLIPFLSNSLGDGNLAHLPWLQAAPDPVTSVVWNTWVEINSKKAEELDIIQGDILTVESPAGSLEAPAYIHPGVPPWVISMPIGQGHVSFGRYAENVGVNTISLLSGVEDKDSGSLAWASNKVSISKTGRHIDISKFEGNVPAFEVDEQRIIKIAPPESHDHQEQH